MKRKFTNTTQRDRWLSVYYALPTHYTPDGRPCTYLVMGEVWHVPRNAPLMLTKTG